MFLIGLFCVLLSIVSAQTQYTDPGDYPPLLTGLPTSDSCILGVVTLAVANFPSCTSNWTCACTNNWGPPLTHNVSQTCGTDILTDVPAAATLLADFCEQLTNASFVLPTFPPTTSGSIVQKTSSGVTITPTTTSGSIATSASTGTTTPPGTTSTYPIAQSTSSGATNAKGTTSGSITQKTSSGTSNNNTQITTTAPATHSGGLTPSQKVGVGVGIGLGVPVLLAAAIGVWFVQGAKKKKPRPERFEQQMGEPIHLGRM